MNTHSILNPDQPPAPTQNATPAARPARETRQLEIHFEASGVRRFRAQAQGRRARARWWFNKMRQTVNRALDWTPAPPARPEQIRLSLAQPGRAAG